jgi:hypothetical protein
MYDIPNKKLHLNLFYAKVMELRTDLRRLHHVIMENDSKQNCDSCRSRNSQKSHHVAIQTDEVEDENLMVGGGGSGIIRVCIMLKLGSM